MAAGNNILYAPFRGNIRSLLQMLRHLRGVSFYCDCIAHCAFWLDTDGGPHGWLWGRRFTARHPLPFGVPFPTADKRYVNDVFRQMSPRAITGGLNHVPIVGPNSFRPTIGRVDFQQRLRILDQLCGFSAGCVDFRQAVWIFEVPCGFSASCADCQLPEKSYEGYF